MPSVAIVILNYNGRKFLEQFLPSVIRTTYTKAFTVVADNASTDDSLFFLQQNYPSIKVLTSPINEGFAKGYNTALKQVDADFYMLLNSDVEITPGWIEPLVDLLKSDEDIAACQPKLLSYHNKKMFEYAGASGGWIDNYGYPFNRGRLFEDIEEDHGQYDDVQQIFWATGAALMIRSKVFHEMNGFDEYFFAHQEEIDLCWRMQLAGYKIYVQPQAVVYHVGGGTLPKGNSKKTFLNFRNNLVMMAKNMRWYDALWKIGFRTMLDALAALKHLLGGDPGGFVAIFRAHWSFTKWLFVGRRKALMPVSRSGNVYGIFKGLIIWKYFAGGKKRFSEIVKSKA